MISSFHATFNFVKKYKQLYKVSWTFMIAGIILVLGGGICVGGVGLITGIGDGYVIGTNGF